MRIFFIDRKSYQGFIGSYIPYVSFFSFNFLDYHKDKKWAHIGIEKRNELIGVIPAYIESNHFISLKGASFGGILIKGHIEMKIEAVEKILNFLEKQKIRSVQITLPPPFSFYRDTDIDYVLWRNDFFIKNRDLGMGIDLLNFRISYHHRRNIEKSKSFVIKKSSVEEIYPLILESWARFNKKPTHTLQDLKYLEDNFPDFIDAYVVFMNNEIKGAIVLFNINKDVSLLFYPVQTESGRENRVMFKLMNFVINYLKNKGVRYFDLGTVSSGKELNSNLVRFKKGWGAGFYTRDLYVKKL